MKYGVSLSFPQHQMNMMKPEKGHPYDVGMNPFL